MDSLKELIEHSEKLMKIALNMKHDDNDLKHKQLDALKDVQEAKMKLKKALADADNIK